MRVSVRAPLSMRQTDLDLRPEKVDARRFTRPVYRERGLEWVKVHACGREGGASSGRTREPRDASAIRESATTSGGSVDPATKVRQYRHTVNFSATQKERTCVFAEERSADLFLPSPVRSLLRSRKETWKEPC